MSLAAGTRLGPYEISSPIGSGGMGDVYRARDTRLGRDVAIKVLPPAMAGDPDRQARFEREARVVASLNHPHICAIYDVGRQAAGDAAVEFLVMELLDGETLAERLAKRSGRSASSAGSAGTTPRPRRGSSGAASGSDPGPANAVRGRALPLDESLRTATQLAEALAAAHRAGIVHRDLKPSNVMLTKAGVKVLDFGLAKLHEPSAAASIDYATATAPLTDVGVVMGTMPYMAPEQVQGHDVDARADLFAFGAILYEMMTGTRAFAADSQGRPDCGAAGSAAAADHCGDAIRSTFDRTRRAAVSREGSGRPLAERAGSGRRVEVDRAEPAATRVRRGSGRCASGVAALDVHGRGSRARSRGLSRVGSREQLRSARYAWSDNSAPDSFPGSPA
jgi:serine/threonine protein kinase